MNPKAREFENDTFLKAELERLVAKHHLKSVIETGTEFGGSANAFARMGGVQIVVTIDIWRHVEDGDLLPNVKFMLGDSRLVLPEAIAYIAEPNMLPCLFFLDAHTSIETDSCPLRRELAIIGHFSTSDLAIPSPVLVIHDCMVPGKDFGYDTYKEGPICWDAVSDLIRATYPNGHSAHFNTEATGSRRGCLFIEPL